MERREFLSYAGPAAAVATLGVACNGDDGRSARRRTAAAGDWEAVRQRFAIDRDYIHMAGLLIAAHPREVSEAIEEYRRSLDANPGQYVEERRTQLRRRSRHSAARPAGAAA